ncbi:homogentisate phytyltransferase [cf. Phormidesmis sp. LEGE 11477]|uniref:homogentisate phytyltransferase n=1 Tax=cf. Phormidesmis sp. LEGE 11477 TaxID=1828680 RepID=UPI00187E7176|nr:homogentisate phytyltransferase [cf. Phormidesmis sp. LEGE 11477]MBE9060831.1 homogentisate phytyltransferase [cf. Phormidesmis sp. LEGE 11477]
MVKSSVSAPPTDLKQPLHPLKNPVAWLRAFWQFSRPHTIVGTSLSTLALLLIAIAPSSSASSSFPSTAAIITSWLLAWIACLGGNVYIVGLNQVEDIAIDRINKPHLPIASGEFTKRHAQKLVGLTGAIAIALALISQNIYLMLTIGLSLVIGTCYSLPPIRLKRFPFWASFCILVVRGAIVNLGLYLYFATQLGLGATVPARVWALTLFVLVFSFAIAIFKDIPDLEGDRQFNISTYTLQLGQKKVFNLARWVLTACYGGLIVAAPFLPGINALFLITAQSIGILSFWWLSRRVDLDPTPVQKDISYPAFYQFIWKLFFVEYLIFPLACWLAG